MQSWKVAMQAWKGGMQSWKGGMQAWIGLIQAWMVPIRRSLLGLVFQPFFELVQLLLKAGLPGNQ